MRKKAFIRLKCRDERWELRKSAPLCANLIPEDGWIRALPHDVGGGLQTGDAQFYDILAEDGARLFWEAPTSTLIMPPVGLDAPPARQIMRLRVRGESQMVHLGKPVIPFRGSRCRTTTLIQIDAESEFLYVELCAPGRTASGESWEFRELGGRLHFYRNKRLLYREDWSLCPPDVPVGSAGFQQARLWGTVLASGTASVGELRRLADELRGRGVNCETGELDEQTMLLRLLDPTGVGALGSLATISPGRLLERDDAPLVLGT